MTSIQNLQTTVDSIGQPMELFVFTPAGNGPHPAIILSQHIPVGHTGIENDTFTLKTAERLASAGYVVAVPFIFHWWPKSDSIEVKREQSRDDWMVADMQASFDYLTNRRDVNKDRIGVVGHCWGGRVAWLAACNLPQLAACAIFYGGRIKTAMGPVTQSPIDLAPNIRCPVIGFFGNDDQNPSPQDVDDYAVALSDAQVSYQFHRYDDAGHAFQNFPTPERYRETQSEDAWSRLFVFLNENLTSS